MERWSGKVAVVTGASAGIGEAISVALVQNGLKVVGLARRLARMEKLAADLQGQPGQFHPVKADVGKESEILAAFEWTKRNLGPVHVLVNNAGIARYDTLVDGDAAKWKEILDVNVLGLCVATREAVKQMREHGIDGHVVHINAVLGHKITPHHHLNVYPASKYAVTALTETLRQELNSIGSKIKVTSISPGYTETEIRQAAGYMTDDTQGAQFKGGPALQSEDVADSVLYVLATPPHVQVHEMIIKAVGEPF